MELSRQVQLGKAAEHLVCADLILQGYNAFLSDQGLPYDVVVDHDSKLYRVQVRATTSAKDYRILPSGNPLSPHIYRFSTLHGNDNVRSQRRRSPLELDVFAFVALDIRVIGYIWTRDLISAKTGDIISLIELKTRQHEYKGRLFTNGTRRKPYGRYLEDYSLLQPPEEVEVDNNGTD